MLVAELASGRVLVDRLAADCKLALLASGRVEGPGADYKLAQQVSGQAAADCKLEMGCMLAPEDCWKAAE